MLGAQLKILGAQLIMLGASISKEKVKSLTVPHLFVIFSLLLLLQSGEVLRSNTIVIFNTNFSF